MSAVVRVACCYHVRCAALAHRPVIIPLRSRSTRAPVELTRRRHVSCSTRANPIAVARSSLRNQRLTTPLSVGNIAPSNACAVKHMGLATGRGGLPSRRDSREGPSHLGYKSAMHLGSAVTNGGFFAHIEQRRGLGLAFSQHGSTLTPTHNRPWSTAANKPFG